MSKLVPLFLFIFLTATSDSTPFSCTTKSTCQSLIGYTNPNSTTLLHIKALFQLKSLRALLSSNNLPITTPPTYTLPPGSTTRIRFTCQCNNNNSSGTPARAPVYKVRPGDGLDYIARNVFNGFVTYQDIAKYNNVSDPNLIEAGQVLKIPLPCGCGEVEGTKVVHYGHVVEMGTDLEGIGREFGVDEKLLLRVNGLKSPKELLAGQVLDVPLRACSSSISNTSLDRNLLVPNASYVLTANNCVQCSCSSTSWQLDCRPIQRISLGSCPAAKCGNLYIGNTSSNSACERSVCTYTGYTNTTISTTLSTQSLCNNDGAPISQPTGGSDQRFSRISLLVLLQTLLIMFACGS